MLVYSASLWHGILKKQAQIHKSTWGITDRKERHPFLHLLVPKSFTCH